MFKNKVRFIWFGGPLTSTAEYLEELSPAEHNAHELMLNFDSLGSPNFVRYVYDGNNSTFPAVPMQTQFGGIVQPGSPGSGAIEQVFLDYFASQGLPVEPIPFNNRSDYAPFILSARALGRHPQGIPAGGITAGGFEDLKTPALVAIYGGTAAEMTDPCFQRPCDTYDNNNNLVLDQMSDAAAHAVLVFAKRDFVKDPLVPPPPPPP